MGLTLATLFFFALVIGLVALPLLPGLREIRRRADARPLRVVRTAEVDIRHFARSFRVWLQEHLGQELADSVGCGRPASGVLDGDLGFQVLPDGAAPQLAVSAQGVAVCREIIACGGALRLPPGALFPNEVYARGQIEGGAFNLYRAILAESDLRLATGSRTMRWAHAGGFFLAGPGCQLLGRVSADLALRLEEGCRFERLHSPTIAFCAPMACLPPVLDATPLTEQEATRHLEVAAGRWLVRGNWAVPAGRLVPASLVVTGRLRIGRGARIAGGVKSHGDLILEERVIVDGGLVSGRNLYISRGCRVHGPAIAEGDAWLCAGSRVGTSGRPTTISVQRLVVEGGAVAHGTVWAHEGGEVMPRPNGRSSYDLTDEGLDPARVSGQLVAPGRGMNGAMGPPAAAAGGAP